ncbi:MAG: hypothetical protein IJM79_00440 [Erysipelotrichaceae bacterium]|nr:hypothetical protein [Erysipelotrichaceae bacterium]
MNNKKIYEGIGSGPADDWMERERRYEAKHSPWDLDDNASYLDEEHRRHCEARELRKQHEENCEVPRPDYDRYQQQDSGNQFTNPSQQFRELRQQLRSAVKQSGTAKAAEKSIGVFIAMISIIIFMFFVSFFIQILLNF